MLGRAGIVLGSSSIRCLAQGLAGILWEDRLENGRAGGWETGAASGGTRFLLVLGGAQSLAPTTTIYLVLAWCLILPSIPYNSLPSLPWSGFLLICLVIPSPLGQL